MTLQQIAQKVEEQLPGRTAQAFIDAANSGAVRSRYQPPEVTTLEGLLFPDTYLIGKGEDETEIVRKLVETFDQKADAVGIAAGAAAIGRTPYEAIVIGSLIEREAGVEEDRPLISAVVANRLRDGMPLQIDATLCFIKGGCTEPLTDDDKLIDSPYNTYQVAALAAGPDLERGRGVAAGGGRAGGGAVQVLRARRREREGTRSRRPRNSTTPTCRRPGRRGCSDHGFHAGGRAPRRPGGALPVPGDAQRRLRRARSRLGVRRVPHPGGAGRGGGAGRPRPRPGRAQRDDAPQGCGRRGLRRLVP